MNNKYKESENDINSLAAGILDEVIKAEMSIHKSQMAAWQWMADDSPFAELMSKDLLDGFCKRKLLSTDEVNLSFHIKPIGNGFLKRISAALKILRGRNVLQKNSIYYQICADSHPGSNKINIVIKRNPDRTFSTSVNGLDIGMDERRN